MYVLFRASTYFSHIHVVSKICFVYPCLQFTELDSLFATKGIKSNTNSYTIAVLPSLLGVKADVATVVGRHRVAYAKHTGG